VGSVFTADMFYNRNDKAAAQYRDMGLLAVEMETAGIYWEAMASRKRALSLLTISDRIFTGDLGELGHSIVVDFFARDGIDISPNYQDCGLLLYDRKGQDMHAGASGCGCAASVLNGYILRHLRDKTWERILFAPTGALLSPVSSGQGESIPSICHVVCLSAER